MVSELGSERHYLSYITSYSRIHSLTHSLTHSLAHSTCTCHTEPRSRARQGLPSLAGAHRHAAHAPHGWQEWPQPQPQPEPEPEPEPKPAPEPARGTYAAAVARVAGNVAPAAAHLWAAHVTAPHMAAAAAARPPTAVVAPLQRRRARRAVSHAGRARCGGRPESVSK